MDTRKTSVFGLSARELEKVVGMETYAQRYVAGATAFAEAEMRRELREWSCVVDVQGTRKTKNARHDASVTRCAPSAGCQFAINGCRRAVLWERRQPAAALSNDMMVYYAPQDVFQGEVTVMEMLCASPCLTTMICFSLEQKLRAGFSRMFASTWRCWAWRPIWCQVM